MNKEKKLQLQKVKEQMLSKMNQSKLRGGLGIQENELIAGCCTQGCCGDSFESFLP